MSLRYMSWSIDQINLSGGGTTPIEFKQKWRQAVAHAMSRRSNALKRFYERLFDEAIKSVPRDEREAWETRVTNEQDRKLGHMKGKDYVPKDRKVSNRIFDIKYKAKLGEKMKIMKENPKKMRDAYENIKLGDEDRILHEALLEINANLREELIRMKEEYIRDHGEDSWKTNFFGGSGLSSGVSAVKEPDATYKAFQNMDMDEGIIKMLFEEELKKLEEQETGRSQG